MRFDLGTAPALTSLDSSAVLQELAAEHPNIMITILGNLTRDFSERLRHANEEIRTLE